MSVKQITMDILKELAENAAYLKDEEIDPMIELILHAGHIFTAGAGRSGLGIRAFTNRLMHLGFSVSNVSEISSPHTHPGDLLIISSGSGETDILVALSKKAKKNGVKIALVTVSPHSTIASMADVVVTLPGISPKHDMSEDSVHAVSFQPMGNAFEQLSFLTYDGIVMELMDRMGETSDTMFARHADLE